MNIEQLSYHLPQENIAHAPVNPRDHSKLLIINRKTEELSHKRFFEIESLLTSNDVLVLNNTKVFPARIFGKKETGGKVEILLLKEKTMNQWEVLGKGIPRVGERIMFPHFTAVVHDKSDHEVILTFDVNKQELFAKLEQDGSMPLPPYIHNTDSQKELKTSYQTVYAKHDGSVAAPTAGLHFTKDLLDRLSKKGIQVEYVTLHVGAGTFLPIKESDITKHPMHSEWFQIEKDTLDRLNAAKRSGKRIISVGTTTTRVLESIAENQTLIGNTLSGETKIFIYPPYRFQFIDALITNFHLPHSTLLALVSAFVSAPNTPHSFTSFSESLAGRAYEEAIQLKYRFYSFGDALFIE